LIPPIACRSAGGCDFAEPVARTGEPALAFWSPAVDAGVLRATAAPADAGDPESFDLSRLAWPATVLRGAERLDEALEYVLIADGFRRLRLALRGASLVDGPVRLRYDLDGFHGLDEAVLSLRRLWALWRLGRLPRSLFPPDRRAARSAMALRAFDGHRAGAAYREIARVVLGERMFAGDVNFESLRKQVARLIGLSERRISVEGERLLGR